MLGRQFIRLASSSAKKSTLRLYGVDGTYATSLFNVAVKDSKINEVSASLNSLSNLLEQDQKLNDIFQNPALSLKDRQTVVDTVIKSRRSNLEPSVANFLNVLAENNRLNFFGKINENFAKLNDNYNGVVNASITTVEPLDGKSFKRIEKALTNSKFVGSGKSLKLSNITNPQIQGGLIIEIEDKTVDLSISARIQKLNRILEETV